MEAYILLRERFDTLVYFCMQALGKGASSIEIGIIIGIAPFTWMVASPIVGYLVSSCRNNDVTKLFFYDNYVLTAASQAWSQVFIKFWNGHSWCSVCCYGVC